VHAFMQSNPTDVVLIAGSNLPDLSMLRWLRVSYPKAAPVLLVERDDREMAVNAFRAGAKGLFLFNHAPFRTLCKCITCVFQGQIWMNSEQTRFVLDALSEVPTLRVVSTSGRALLTPREEQVVALVADGLSNRGVADELGSASIRLRSICCVFSTNWASPRASNWYSMPFPKERTARPNGCRVVPEQQQTSAPGIQ